MRRPGSRSGRRGGGGAEPARSGRVPPAVGQLDRSPTAITGPTPARCAGAGGSEGGIGGDGGGDPVSSARSRHRRRRYQGDEAWRSPLFAAPGQPAAHADELPPARRQRLQVAPRGGSGSAGGAEPRAHPEHARVHPVGLRRHAEGARELARLRRIDTRRRHPRRRQRRGERAVVAPVASKTTFAPFRAAASAKWRSAAASIAIRSPLPPSGWTSIQSFATSTPMTVCAMISPVPVHAGSGSAAPSNCSG